jgi:hypothetical protein
MPDPTLSELPVGTVVTVGHPGNGRLAARARDGWLDLGTGAEVDPEDFRAGWAIVGVPPVEPGPSRPRTLWGVPLLWPREQGDPPPRPEGTDVRPKDRRAATDEFCHHPKGDASRTVPPCLRTLDDEGRCPVHVDDVFGLGQRIRHYTLGTGRIDSDERLDGQVLVRFDSPVPVFDGHITDDAVWCNPHNLSPEEPSRA